MSEAAAAEILKQEKGGDLQRSPRQLTSGARRELPLGWRFTARALGLTCLFCLSCSSPPPLPRTENPQPDIEIRVNGRLMDVRSAIFEVNGGILWIQFLSRAVNCHEISVGKDSGGDDAVEVGVHAGLDTIVRLTIGKKSAGRSIRDMKVQVTETYSHPNQLWPEGATGTIDVATSTLEVRGNFTARGCGARVHF